MDVYIAEFYFKRKYPNHIQRFYKIFEIIVLGSKLR